MAGEEVEFKGHQGPASSFVIKYDAAVEERPQHERKIGFDQTAIFLDAAGNCDEAVVEAMLQEGMDPNVKNADGLTALHQAAIENSPKIAALVLGQGADVNAKDNDWWTALHAAAACGNWRIASALIRHDADVTAVNADGDLAIDLVEDSDKLRGLLEEEMASPPLPPSARGAHSVG